MMSSPAYKDFLYSLPSPGSGGTLTYNMKSYPEELRSRIKAKSGSMNGIRCYSGYVLPSTNNGKVIIFSILTGNCTAPSWKVRQLLDKLMATIAENN
jgi:D-alanyl-D-alanine carboxypeptidase/D-alanyl-D-alanine-endopeptidase (penicillin-binding protein 4)